MQMENIVIAHEVAPSKKKSRPSLKNSLITFTVLALLGIAGVLLCNGSTQADNQFVKDPELSRLADAEITARQQRADLQSLVNKITAYTGSVAVEIKIYGSDLDEQTTTTSDRTVFLGVINQEISDRTWQIQKLKDDQIAREKEMSK